MALTGHRWTLAGLVLLLSACAGTPPEAPDGGRATSAPLITAPGEIPDAATERDPLLEPVRAALASRDWISAQLALPKLAMDADSDPEFSAWLRYYAARVALLRGDLQDYRRLLDGVGSAESFPALREEVLTHRLEQAELAGDAAARAENAFSLLNTLEAGAAPVDRTAAAERQLWLATQALRGVPAGAPWRSWWELSRAASIAAGASAVAALDGWLQRYPEHRAAPRARQLREAAVLDAELQHPALLLPQTGPLGSAGEAVGDGFIAAWYNDPLGIAQVEVLDTRRYPSITEAHDSALQRGADRVVGPLSKQAVAQLLESGHLPPPLTLNRPDHPVAPTAGSLQLSLAPEDEAQQIARRAFQDGGRHALVIRPEGAWGARMEAALREPWDELGGSIRARAEFSNSASSHSASIREALNLDASAERSRDLRRMFPGLESSGRRRDDIDVIFLLCRSADEARSLRPQIDYHYAGDLPVYALSTVDDGASADANRDLEGIRLPVAPWRLGTAPPGLSAAAAADAFSALHALGADAWALVLRQRRLAAGAGLRYRGHTALFSVADDASLLRQLPMAEFDGGELRRR